MVHSAMTTVMMAGEGQPVFHDFLGMSYDETSTKQQTDLTTTTTSRISRSSLRSTGFEEEIDAGETSTKASSGASGLRDTPALLTGPLALGVPSCSDPGSERLSWSQSEGLQSHGTKSAFYRPDVENRSTGKKRDSSASNCRDSWQDRIQINAEALDSPRGMKMSRFESKDDKRARQHDDDLHLAMQPPRPNSTGQTLVQPSMCTKPDLMASKKWEHPVSLNTGTAVYGPSRLSQLGAYTERTSTNAFRENTAMPPILSRPAADEGSRTGLKGSGIANLITSGPSTTAGRNTSGPGLSVTKSKFSSQSGGPESSIPSSQQIAVSASRQLTIFYGGQAHVFDDVHPNKADAIMALAGSNGRSWSTTYSPRPRSSLQSSASEGYVSASEREKAGNRITAVNSASGLGLSPELQTLLPTIAHAAQGSSRLVQSAPMADPKFVQLTSGSMQVSIGGNECKDVPLMARPISCSNEGDKETVCHNQQLV
eukprot:Gb_32508 [translate_table: standard]